MSVRLNITMDEELYRRLKQDLPRRGLSAFINEAVRAHLHPDRRTLDEAYRAASRERWRRRLVADWKHTEMEDWPD